MGICLFSRTDYRICIARLDFSYYVDRFCALQCDTDISSVFATKHIVIPCLSFM